MIKAVRCDKKSFKEVRFTPGFNVVLADRTKTSGDRDSRNGLGKTTLIEIIHFCLGASTQLKKGLRVPELHDWTFIIELTLQGKDVTVYRNTANFGIVKLEGDFSGWTIQPEFNEKENAYEMKIKDWNICLGYLMFQLETDLIKDPYSPTFRSLFSYFARRGTAAFEDAFKHHSLQQPWDVQVNNACLLGLNWEYAAQFQKLKDKKKTLTELKKAAKQGMLTGFMGSIGELEAGRISLEEKINNSNSQLKNFKVYPQYTEMQNEANKLTKNIHDLVNKRTIDQRLLEQYNTSIEEEKDIPLKNVEKIYQKAGLIFLDEINKKLDDVLTFHAHVVQNRKSYLKSEIDHLKRIVEKQSNEIELLSDKRAGLLNVLKTHGALDEYVELQNRNTELKQQLNDIESRIQNLKKFETGISELKIEREELLQKARRDFDERQSIADKARLLFNYNSENLYAEPGRLNIDLSETGYKFEVDIKRTRSQGIGYMKVFCYDLMLIQLRAGLLDAPGFLIHDSTIFNGVDERQIAKALELAALKSAENKFQYIVALNSDQVPFDDFSDNFRSEFDDAVRIKFTDATDDGGLLGIKF